MALPIFDKTTPAGKSLRTWVQAAIGLTGFFMGLIAIPGVYEYLSKSPIFAGGALITTIAVVTYVQNALEKVWAYLNAPYDS